MRISTKGRYALASMTHIARQYSIKEPVTIVSISNTLGISKIYLEQVFFLLKRNNLVHSVKGAQGGYKLIRHPEQITVFDILSAVEVSMFEQTQRSVWEQAPDIERALDIVVYQPLAGALEELLKTMTLANLVSEADENKLGQEVMFYI